MEAWIYEWQCRSVGLSVGRSVGRSTTFIQISPTEEWTDMEFQTGIYGPKRMNPTDSHEPLMRLTFLGF